MPRKMIKKKSSLKRKPPKGARSAGITPRRRAVSSAEEELFAKAFRSSPHPIGITELETGRCLEVNDACLEIFGFRRDEVVGETTLMLGIWPEPQERARLIDRLKSEGAVRNLEVSMRMKDGKLRQFIISTDLITLGGKLCLLTIGNDITERKKAEDALRESEQRFRAIYDQTYEFIGLLTPDGTLIDVNQTALAFRGLQRSDVVGKPFWETPWWDLSRELQAKLRAAIAEAATGIFVRLRAQHRAQDGAIEEIDFSLTPIVDRTGKVTQIIPEGRRITPLTNALDRLRETQAGLERQVLERTAALTQLTEQLQAEIVERKQVQEVLRARSAELQITLDTAATGLVRNSRDLRYRWVNEAYAKLVGRPVEDIVGCLLSDVLGAEGFVKVRPHIDRVLRGERVEYETELPIAGRGFRWLHVVYMPDRDTAGDVIGWVGSITDITERKQAEETVLEKQRELQQSQVQLQDLSAKLFTAQDSERQRIARDLHDDFSQRLAALVLDVTSLQQQPPLLPELIGKALEPVREELQQLCNDLHDLAYRLHPPLLRHLGLQAAIEDHIAKAIERTGLHIVLQVKNYPRSIPLEWSTCLFRVLQESLQNVAKHARATEVLVRLCGSSKGVGLSVIDNGKGFDARDKSGHQKGLGLVGMQERLRLLNGFLNIHSRSADGTKVCAWIPFQEKIP